MLRGVDLHLDAGTTTALVGASGSGKTTLMKHILGLVQPDEGTVTIGGQDVWASNPAQLREMRRNLSALHGGSTVYEGSVLGSVSVRENLLTRLHEKYANPSTAAGGSATKVNNNPYVRLWTEGLQQVEALPQLAERAQHWLDRFELSDVADLFPHQASAGQRRRAALAAALSVDAQLYLLDDPDGAIDRRLRRTIVEAIAETRARTGATMLIATHDLDLAEAVSDKIAVLAGGRIVVHSEPEYALYGIERWYWPQASNRVRPGTLVPLVPTARRPRADENPTAEPAPIPHRAKDSSAVSHSPKRRRGLARRWVITATMAMVCATLAAIMLVAGR